MLFSAIFNNISVISWLLFLFVSKPEYPEKYHRPAASHWQNFIT